MLSEERQGLLLVLVRQLELVRERGAVVEVVLLLGQVEVVEVEVDLVL